MSRRAARRMTDRNNQLMRRLLFDNLLLKFIALVLSLVIFLVVRGEAARDVHLEVPVLFDLPEGWVMTSPAPTSVLVTLKGRAGALEALRAAPPGPLLVPIEAQSDPQQRRLEPRMLKLPEGVEIRGFDPPELGLTVEPLLRRAVPIEVRRSLWGAVPAGFRVGRVRATPERATLIGPRSRVEAASRALVEAIDLTGHTASFNAERAVFADRAGVTVEAPARARIAVEVLPEAHTRQLEGVEVLVTELERRHELVPARVVLTLIGPPEALAQARPDQLLVALSGAPLRGGPPRAQRLRVRPEEVINLPASVIVDEASLPSVVVRTLDPDPLQDGPTRAAPPGTPDALSPDAPGDAPRGFHDPASPGRNEPDQTPALDDPSPAGTDGAAPAPDPATDGAAPAPDPATDGAAPAPIERAPIERDAPPVLSPTP